MNFKKLTDQAKAMIDKRGGTDALKGDLDELKTVAQGKGTLSEKAKAAADALKKPGAERATDAPSTPADRSPASPSAPDGPATPPVPPTAQDVPPAPTAPPVPPATGDLPPRG